MQGAACSVALGDAGATRCVRSNVQFAESDRADPDRSAGTRPNPRSAVPASRAALELIDEVLRETGLRSRSLAGYCVALGPGAFTALRVGAAIVQGLALADNKPVIGVASLAALAVDAIALDTIASASAANAGIGQAPESVPDRPGRGGGACIVLTAQDARMGECYFAAWWFAAPLATGRGGAIRPLALIPPGLARAADVAAAFTTLVDQWSRCGDEDVQWRVAGDAFEIHEALSKWLAGIPLTGSGIVGALANGRGAAEGVLGAALGARSRTPRLLVPRAAAGGALAGKPLLGAIDYPPIVGAAACAQPLYIRDKVALDVDEQRASSANRQRTSAVRGD